MVTLLGNCLAQAGWLPIALSCVTTRGPNKECGTASEKVTGRTQEGLKGVRTWQRIVCLVKLTYESSGGAKKRREESICPTNLPESFWLKSILAERCMHHQEGPWVRMFGQRQPGNQPHYHKSWDCEPRGGAVLLGSLSLLLSTKAPLSKKVFCFVSLCISLDHSFLSVRQELTLGPCKGVHFMHSVVKNVLVKCEFCLGIRFNASRIHLVCFIWGKWFNSI